MNIVNISWYGSPHIGGIEVYLDELARQLGKYGHNLTLACGTVPQKDNQFYFSYLDKSKQDVTITELTESLLIRNADVINFHNTHLLMPERGKTLFETIKGNTFLNVHNLSLDSESWEIISLFGSRVVVFSEYMQEIVRNKIDVNPVLLQHCFPTDFSNLPKTKPNSTFSIYQPTRFSNWKGSHLSLMAAVTLLENGINIEFTHGGIKYEDLTDKWDNRWKSLYPDLLQKVHRWHEEGKITFQAYSHSESLEKINSSDVILHPTTGIGITGEPYSISVAEAVLMSKAVIVSNSGNLPRIVEGYPLAKVVSVGEYIPIISAIARLMNNSRKNNTETYDLSILRKKIEESPKQHMELYEGKK